MTPAYRQPPVEPALCHRGSPTVAGEGWGAQSRALAAVAGPGHPPDCVLAQGTPPWFHPHTTVRSRAPGRQWGNTQCAVCSVRYTECSAQCTLHATHYVMHTAHCVMHTAHRTLQAFGRSESAQ